MNPWKIGLFGLGFAMAVQAAAAMDRLLDPSEIYEIGLQDLRKEIRVAGTAVAERHTVVSARVSGAVLAVHARPGEEVRKGDLLVELDDTDLALDLLRRQAAVDVAEAARVSARQTLERNADLGAKGHVSASTQEAARAAHDQAEAQLRSALSDLKIAEVALGRAKIVSPMDGQISGRDIEPGQLIQSGTAIMNIIATDRLVLEAKVPFSSALDIRPGMTARLHVPRDPNRLFDARVDRVNPELETDSRSATAYLIIENPDDALRAGAYLGGTIAIEERSGAVAVPASAVTKIGERHIVMGVRDGLARTIRVEVGSEWSNGALVEIRDGLSPGDLVLRAPLAGIADGDSVEIGG